MPETTAAIGGRYARQATNTREHRPEHYRSGANRAPFPELGETSRMNDTNRFLRLAEVQEITGLGKTTIRREREPWCSPSPTRQTFPSRQTWTPTPPTQACAMAG